MTALAPSHIIAFVGLLLLNFLFKISNRLTKVNFLFNIGEFMEIGSKIKRLRLQLNLSQTELADRCELTKGYISQLENDLTSPSISTLCDILSALGTDLSEFFRKEDDTRIVFTASDFIEKREGGMLLKWIIPNAQKNDMEPVLVELLSGASTSVDFPHEGEEFGYVLEGKVCIELGKNNYVCKKGEAFYYTANKPHNILNCGKNIAKFIWISTPPNF